MNLRNFQLILDQKEDTICCKKKSEPGTYHAQRSLVRQMIIQADEVFSILQPWIVDNSQSRARLPNAVKLALLGFDASSLG